MKYYSEDSDMSCYWTSTPSNRRYGIAIYNFQDEGPYRLKLFVGETVSILQETELWYYGYTLQKPSTRGIFPKSYIHLLDNTTENNYVAPISKNQPPIVQEITTILKDWGLLWKTLYISNSGSFDQIRKQIYDLITQRNKIVSGTLPTDELKSITREVARKIDEGNKLLSLDLVLRDSNGNIISPDETSTIQLYYNHKFAVEQMSAPKNERKENRKTAIQQYSHVFILSVKNFTCKMQEDAELLISLYDAKEYKPITENYLVHWSRNGLMADIDQMNNLRVLFTDLGKKDLTREKIFLVCYVVRSGGMDLKEVDTKRRSSRSALTNSLSNTASIKRTDIMRRPLGVAAKDITAWMNVTEIDMDKDVPIPFYMCDKDNLETTLKKMINKEDKNESRDQSLFVRMKLLQGDITQVREEHAHLVLGTVTTARKMGFPEVILPGDVRNDLYLTILSGDFSKSVQTNNKNIEVGVTVCNDSGITIPGVISLGDNKTAPLNVYQSVIYYHEDKPQWHETFKVAIQIDEFKSSHIKFMFKHRSSNEAKDKSEKPFAMAFVKLMEDNGTTLKDAVHKLCVYRIDPKKFDFASMDYYSLPTTLEEVSSTSASNKLNIPGLSLSLKDAFSISSNICSTKLTQNVDLLGLLNWTSHKESLKVSLQALKDVDGEEVVKFLQDILDALFSIFMENADSDEYDVLVFDCLLFIIALVCSDWKYQHFEPVLNLYIKESFSATLAYSKLLTVLVNLIQNRKCISSQSLDMFKTMKSLQYFMKFISQSRLLYVAMTTQLEDDNFEESLSEFFNSIISLMEDNNDSLLREQGAFLKYFPNTIPDIIVVYDRKKLSKFLEQMLTTIPNNRLTKQKMMTINEIIHSELFHHAECREILLPIFTVMIEELFKRFEEDNNSVRRKKAGGRWAKLAKVLGEEQHKLKEHKGYPEEVSNRNDEIELCIKILSDILDLLFRKDIGPTQRDLNFVITNNLRIVIQSYASMTKENPCVQNLVAIMIDIFRQMNKTQYEHYIKSLLTQNNVLDFLVEIHVVFRQLVDQSVYNSDWCEMILMQNFVIQKALKFFSLTIQDYFFVEFEPQAWNNHFHCAIAYMTQPALQLELFSSNKRSKILKRYGDLRKDMGLHVKTMWFNLGQYKQQFVPGLVCNMLEMTLIPQEELRIATIPIFFDMMQCEYYSSKFEPESYGDTKLRGSHVKGNFQLFENEMIMKLDTLVEGGRGDEEYKVLFNQIMLDMCVQHSTIKEEGIKFVRTLTKLMESLLEYRCIINDENKENRMICIVNLLYFYAEINRKEMFIRYINKLYNLHLECENYTEAAYTLMQHSDLLNWSDEKLPNILKGVSNSNFDTHRQLKEYLFLQIVDNFKKGRMWECALEKSKELMREYEEKMYDYGKLAVLHTNMAEYYRNILRTDRAHPEYFRVAYYGNGFPAFLRNKVFVYRGKECERLGDFTNRILNAFPKASSLNYLDAPKEDVINSEGQHIQINKVDPMMDVCHKKRFSGKPVAETIAIYYRANNVRTFVYSRPFKKRDESMNIDNEFAYTWLERTMLTISSPLPGTLRWFPVIESTMRQISPLQHAVEAMEHENTALYRMVQTCINDKNHPMVILSMKLKGILDPTVMGGIRNYETCFFIPEYLEHHPQDDHLIQKLKDLIAEQLPLLKIGVTIHGERASDSTKPLQEHFMESYAAKEKHIVDKYGKKECDLRYENNSIVTRPNRIQSSVIENTHNPDIVKSVLRLKRGSPGSASFNTRINSTAANFSSKTSLSPAFRHVINSPSKNMSHSTPTTLKKIKTPKEKRKSGKDANCTGTQWYTSEQEATANGTPLVELRQELLPKRPLRSDVEREKRLSRSSNGQSSRPSSMSIIFRPASNSETNSNRDSVGTTDSSVSEEDLQPPPLPMKHSKSDSLDMSANTSFLYSNRTVSLQISKKEISDGITNMSYEEATISTPPAPPPKPTKKKFI